MPKIKTKKEIIRVDGKLKQVITVHDHKGNILQRIVHPLMVEFHLKDVLQVILGATLLAIPVGFTEETWKLGATLPWSNIIGFLVLSLLFIGLFSYYNYYQKKSKEHWDEFLKRVVFTYILSFLVVGLVMWLIKQAPLSTDWVLSVKRIIIVTFPASMSAAVADVIK